LRRALAAASGSTCAMSIRRADTCVRCENIRTIPCSKIRNTFSEEYRKNSDTLHEPARALGTADRYVGCQRIHVMPYT